jgi:hypothetical protein
MIRLCHHDCQCCGRYQNVECPVREVRDRETERVLVRTARVLACVHRRHYVLLFMHWVHPIDQTGGKY